MKNQYRGGTIPFLGILVAIASMTGCSKKDLTRPAPEVAVVTLQPERVAITSELPGRTSAYLVAEVHPQVNGIIQKRLFTEGGDVKEGEVLYQIDPRPYQAAYDTAAAALARVEANLPAVRKRAERFKELLSVNAVGQQDAEDAAAAFKQAEAEVQALKAGVESARINLGYTRILAPISGRIGKSSVTPGALAAAYQGPAFTTIQQLDQLYVDSPQSSATLLEIKRKLAAKRIKGSADQAKVKLVLEDGTPYSQPGLLKFSDVTVDPSTGSQVLRMVFPNSNHILMPGMYVRAIVEEGVAEQAILVPQQGVTRDPKGNAVAMVVDVSNKVEQRALTIDRAIGTKWLVTEGLAAGDRVILEGLQKVRPGVVVKVVPFEAKPAPAAAK
ncbi:MAG: efflux RND transporter periplasmic adaptor subunit [Holophagaceae bacterium]|uniref:Efflux RND transporter periplasmic adaptor subunit n=1 Tax=Candidatus Geothrix odensensis TaxID=2954440 RepID=A0A936F3G5_9BACT|nr:efflux RND transporter periplasmic adaptor subunit [Candidatus Geothrix odensensis]